MYLSAATIPAHDVRVSVAGKVQGYCAGLLVSSAVGILAVLTQKPMASQSGTALLTIPTSADGTGARRAAESAVVGDGHAGTA